MSCTSCTFLQFCTHASASQVSHSKTHFEASHRQVRAVKLRRERIVVALEHKVLVYDFKDLKLLHSIETLSNPTGLVALSPSQDQTVMACPGLHCGQVGSWCHVCPIFTIICMPPLATISGYLHYIHVCWAPWKVQCQFQSRPVSSVNSAL